MSPKLLALWVIPHLKRREPKRSRVVLFAVLGVLVFLFAGCAQAPVYVRELPPAVLLEPCEEPVSTLETNKDLAQWALDLRTALRLCNNDKEALRDWAKEPE